MARKSDSLPLVLVGGSVGLSLLFHTIWNILFEDWIKHQLEHFFGHTVAEMLERFGSVGFPVLAAIALIWLIYSYAKAHVKADLAGQSGASPIPAPATIKPPVFDQSWIRDVSLANALWRAYSGNWNGWQRIMQPSPEADKFYKIVDEIRQYAFEGALPIWAKRPKSNLYELVPPTFWQNHAIADGYSIASTVSDVFIYVTHTLSIGEHLNARTNAWEDFMTSKPAVDKLWPASRQSG